MIRSLRRRHLVTVAAAAVVVVPLFIAAIVARPERPLGESLAERFGTAAPGPAAGRVVEMATDPVIEVAIGAGGGTVSVSAPTPVEAPGLLLYWQPGETEFPQGAVFIGAVRGHGVEIFEPGNAVKEAEGRSGNLVLYSLGHGEVVARAAWPRGAAP